MPNIPLGTQSYGDNASLIPEILFNNLLVESIPAIDDSGSTNVLKRKRPSVELHVGDSDSGNIVGLCRPIGIFNSNIFVVVQNDDDYLTLWRYDNNDANPTNLGQVSTTKVSGTIDYIKMIYTQFGLCILNNLGELYVYEVSGILKQLTMPSGVTSPIQDICDLNNYLIIGLQSGTFYWLDPNTWDTTTDEFALNFATAESYPDQLVSLQNVRGELYIFGQISIEVWQDTGGYNTTSTFTKAIGRDLLRGCKSRNSSLVYDNTAVFIGQDNIVYRCSDIPIRISNSYIEQTISTSSYANLWSYTYRGHLVLVIDLENNTFCYDAMTQLWSTMTSSGKEKFAFIGVQDLNYVLLYNLVTRNIYHFNSDVFEDYDGPIDVRVSGVLLSSKPLIIKSLTLITSQNDAAEYLLSWRDSGGEYSTPRVISTNQGEMTMKSIYFCGCVSAPYRIFKIETTSNTSVDIISLSFNNPTQGGYRGK